MGCLFTQADPNPRPDPIPVADPLAQPLAVPEAAPQQQVYAPFSGAIYIVGADGSGSGFGPASPAQCPANAQQSCGNINVWNW